MARTRAEQRAASRQVAGMEAEVFQGGAATYRVAVDHKDDAHDVSPVPFHFGPAYNQAYAETAADILGVGVGDVDLRAQAEKGLEQARAAYPEADGYTHWVEVIYPEKPGDPDNERHLVRRAASVEGK